MWIDCKQAFLPNGWKYKLHGSTQCMQNYIFFYKIKRTNKRFLKIYIYFLFNFFSPLENHKFQSSKQRTNSISDFNSSWRNRSKFGNVLIKIYYIIIKLLLLDWPKRTKKRPCDYTIFRPK